LLFRVNQSVVQFNQITKGASPMAQQPDPYHFNSEQQTLFNRALLVLLGVGIGWLFFSDKQGYLANIFSEAMGAVGTFLVLDWWIRRRDERQQTEELKHKLVREMGSPVNATTVNAIREIRERRWQHGEGSILKGVKLAMANLQEASLEGFDLEGTILVFANLRQAHLNGANLSGAHLFGADLRDAVLNQTHMDERTLLPDGSHWTPDTDMNCFTDSNHPDFWEPRRLIKKIAPPEK
jgi:hypothetical protein